MAKSKKDTGTAEHLKRYTMQIDEQLFKMMKTMGTSRGINTYIIANMLLILGIEEFNKKLNDCKDITQSVKIELKQRSLDKIRGLVKDVVNKKLGSSVLW